MSFEFFFETKPKNTFLNSIGQLLITSKLAKLVEILLLFTVSISIINLFISTNPKDMIYNQLVIWIANIVMLFMVFTGIKLRGEGLQHFGFSFKKTTWEKGFKMFMISIVVAILATIGFVLGSIIIGYFVGIPESSDLSGYDYVIDNIWMLFLTLGGVYIVASFGEEVIYRAFLINRLTELGIHGKIGKVVVVVLSAIVFGLVHYNWGLMGVVQTSFMGLVFCISYLFLNKKIWILILAHAYMDTFLFLQVYFN